QAEDGIRDRNVTGVQTCALPIYSGNSSGFIVANLYNDPSHSITNKLLSLTVIVISVSGSFLIISLNIIAFTTVFPCSATSHSIKIGRASCRERVSVSVLCV